MDGFEVLTLEGTRIIKEITDGTSGTWFKSFYSADDFLYFVALEGFSTLKTGVWRTDGTEEGTIKLININEVTELEDYTINDLITFNDQLVLSSSEALFTYDTITDNVSEIADFTGNSTNLKLIDKIGDLLYFKVYDEVWDLWVTDGTASGTRMIYESGSLKMDDVYFLNDQPILDLYGVGDYDSELYSLDTATKTATVLKEVDPTQTNFTYDGPRNVVAAQDYLFFFQGNSTYAEEPYVSNGTPEGTFLLKNIREFGSSGPEEAVAWGNYVVFSAFDTDNGQEIWITD